MDNELRPGKYRHFKGKEYELICTATHSETMELMVVYRALYGEFGVWVRPLSMWNELVEVSGKKVPRFTYIGGEETWSNALNDLWHRYTPKNQKRQTITHSKQEESRDIPDSLSAIFIFARFLLGGPATATYLDSHSLVYGNTGTVRTATARAREDVFFCMSCCCII